MIVSASAFDPFHPTRHQKPSGIILLVRDFIRQRQDIAEQRIMLILDSFSHLGCIKPEVHAQVMTV